MVALTRIKKIALCATSLLLLSVCGFSQKNLRIDTIKGSGNAMDTIITIKTERSFGKTFLDNHKIDEAYVKALKPYLVSDIVDPTNRSHPRYRQRLREARQTLPLAKADILQRMKVAPTVKERMAKANIHNEADLDSVNFVYLPVYYLTPNVVYFKKGENIAKYHNLGIGGFKYLMLRNNKLIGSLYFYQNNYFKSDFSPMRLHEGESFDQIIKLGKTPIGLDPSVRSDPTTIGAGGGCMFGFLEQEHLVFSYYEEGIADRIGLDGYLAPNPRYYKNYIIETAEFFLSVGGNGSLINSWLKNEVNKLKNRPPR